MWGLGAAWVLPLLLGHAALLALAAPQARARAGRWLRWATAIPLGTAITSIVASAAAAMFGDALLPITLAEVGVLAGLVLLARRRWPHHAGPPSTPIAVLPWWLRLAAALGVVGAATLFVAQARAFPFGDADGIAIWGNRAVFLRRAFGDWALVFSPELVHTDYPLLLPAALARAWLYTGGEPPLAGTLLAFAFTACTFVALASSIAVLRDRVLGALALLALCATPFFAVHGAGQAGDVPVACYLLLACAWLRIGGPQALALAGACAWASAWTKNEGLLAAAVLTALVFAAAAREGGGRAALRATGAWLLGGMPAIAAVVAFKVGVAPRNDLLANHDLARLVPMLGSGERWRLVAAAFADLAVRFRGAGTVAGCSAAVLVALAALFWRPRGVRFFATELATVSAVAACEFVVFLLSPYDLRWHLGTALDRVLLQLWPLALFGVFRALTSPVRVPAD